MRSSVALVAILLAGCCTQIGCSNMVVATGPVDLQEGVRYTIQACLGGSCWAVELRSDGQAIGDDIAVDPHRDVVTIRLPPGRLEGEHRLSIDIAEVPAGGVGGRIARFDAPITFVHENPNGPLCGEGCWQAEIELLAVE